MLSDFSKISYNTEVYHLRNNPTKCGLYLLVTIIKHCGW